MRGATSWPPVRPEGRCVALPRRPARGPARRGFPVPAGPRQPTFEEFYRQSIAGIEQETRRRFGGAASYPELDDARQREVIDAAAADETLVWTTPPPSFFYFVSRADAVDVAYGTEAGFRRLRVPYIAHIRPPDPW